MGSLLGGIRFHESDFLLIVLEGSPSSFAYFVSALAYSVCAESFAFGWNVFLSGSSSSCDVFNLVPCHFLAEVRGWAEALDNPLYRHACVQEK